MEHYRTIRARRAWGALFAVPGAAAPTDPAAARLEVAVRQDRVAVRLRRMADRARARYGSGRTGGAALGAALILAVLVGSAAAQGPGPDLIRPPAVLLPLRADRAADASSRAAHAYLRAADAYRADPTPAHRAARDHAYRQDAAAREFAARAARTAGR